MARGNIPSSFIHNLVERADLVEVIKAHVKLELKGGSFWGLCPFHAEKTPSFSVNPQKGFYYCFGCGENGDALTFLIKHLCGGDFISGVEMLSSHLGLEIPRTHKTELPDTGEVLKKALDHWKKNLTSSSVAMAYIEKRGLTMETVERFQLGYAKDSWNDLFAIWNSVDKKMLKLAGLVRESDKGQYDYFRNRLMFPITETNNRLCGFGGRTLSEEETVKYINSPESAQFRKRHILFGLSQAMANARKQNRLIICEGYMDVLMLSQYGFTEAVATMGTAATSEQMKKAMRYTNRIIFAYDGDLAGKKGAQKALVNILPCLKDGFQVSFLFLPQGYDPDSYLRQFGQESLSEAIEKAVSLSDLMLSMLEEEAKMDDKDARATHLLKAGEALIGTLNKEEAHYWRQLLTNKLCERTGINVTHLRQPAKPQTQVSRSRLTLQGELFVLLCLLKKKPQLVNHMQETIPLIGDTIGVQIIAHLLNQLRWNMDEELSDVSVLLEKEGYLQLAEKVRERSEIELSKNVDLDARFMQLLQYFQSAHRRKTKAGKKEELRKIRQAIPSIT